MAITNAHVCPKSINSPIQCNDLRNARSVPNGARGIHGDIWGKTSRIQAYHEDGGLLYESQVVDFAFGIAPGVFAVIYSEDDYVNYEMEYLKMGKGP